MFSCALLNKTFLRTGQLMNGIALVRPPGHHAMTSEFNGFCLCNNVALAAQNAIDNLGVKKVLIVDFDAHHGQATQRQFYDSSKVSCSGTWIKLF
jgi:histone deacetylase 6